MNVVVFTGHETRTDTLFNRLTALARKLNHTLSLHPHAHKGTDRLTRLLRFTVFPPATCSWPLPYRAIQTDFLICFFSSHSLELFASLPLSDFWISFACSIMLPSLRLYQILCCVNWHGYAALRGSLPVYTENLSLNNYTQQYQKIT